MVARPRLRVPFSSLAAGRAVLDADTARYVGRVHRLGPGDAFVAFDPRAAVEAVATIVAGEGGLTVEVGEVVATTCLPPARVTLLQGVAKAGKLDDVVRDATELGVSRIVPVICQRSQGSTPPRVDRLQRVALEAARQSGRGDVPDIAEPTSFGALEALGGKRIVLVPDATDSFGALALRDTTEVAILVGPEGGLSPDELESLRVWGFGAARLGPFVMRTETAAAAALGAFWAGFEGPVGA